MIVKREPIFLGLMTSAFMNRNVFDWGFFWGGGGGYLINKINWKIAWLLPYKFCRNTFQDFA